MEIRVYSAPDNEFSQFVPKAMIFAAISIEYTENFYTPGKFQITIPAKSQQAEEFRKYRIIRINKQFWGIILGCSLETDSGGDTMTVSGCDLKGLMSARTTVPPQLSGYEGAAGYDAVMGSSETIMKHFVTSNFITTLQPARKVAGFVVAEDKGRGLLDDKYMSRYEVLSDTLQKIGEAAKLGYTVKPDLSRGTIIFDVAEGIDRSAAQLVRPRVVFSPEMRNINEQHYSNDDSSMRNVFYATMSGSEFADEAYTAIYTREDEQDMPTGLCRWEQHLSLSVNTPTAGEEYNELKRIALIDAESYRTEENFKCGVAGGGLEYGVHYNLGDIVTARNQVWGVTTDAQITSMSVSADSSGVKSTIGLGKSNINIFGRLKRQIKNRG